MWIEIFKGGKQTDSLGREQDGDWFIDQAISKFSPDEYEPPVVLGHPRNNHPAWGWVESLKTEIRDGCKVLFAKLKDLQPEFVDLINRKMYKKRSASFHKDGSLRHIAFLGAIGPAVRALKDINPALAGMEFSESAAFEFSQPIEFGEDEMDLEKIKAMVEDPNFQKFMEQTEKLFQIWKEVAEKDQARADQAGGGSDYSEAADSLYDHRAGVPLTMKV